MASTRQDVQAKSISSLLVSTTSPATNRLASLRQSIHAGEKEFLDVLGRKTHALFHDAKQLRLRLQATDHQVVVESKKRNDDDARIERAVEQRLADAAHSFEGVLTEHTRRLGHSIRVVDETCDAVLAETASSRAAQDALVAAIRDEHRRAVEALRAELDAVRMSVISFEGTFSAELSRSFGHANDCFTVEASVRQRSDAEILSEVRAMLGHDEVKVRFEAHMATLMKDLRGMQDALKENCERRDEAVHMFTDTMNAMVVEVREAVKKMNVSRGVERLARRREPPRPDLGREASLGGGGGGSPRATNRSAVER